MNTKPTRPSRARKPKAAERIVEGLSEAADVQKMLDAARSDLMASLPPSLTAADLRAKLDETSAIRQRLAAEIDRISTSLAEHQRALIGCDGALQVLGQLIEAVEAKSKEGEA